MKDLSRKVTLYCPICGNDQFRALDDEFDTMIQAPDESRLMCSDCHNIFTKEQLLEENQEVINAAVDEVKAEAVKKLEREFKKALRKLR